MEGILTKILRKPNKHELAASILEWGVLNNKNIDFTAVKGKLAKNILHEFENSNLNSTLEDLWKLDLICLKNSGSTFPWYVHVMDSSVCIEEEAYRPENFRNLMQSELEKLTIYSVVVIENHKALWGRICKPSEDKPLYFVHFPMSKYVLCSINRENNLKDDLFKSFGNIFKCKNIAFDNLESKDVRAVAEICLYVKEKDYTYDEGFYKPKPCRKRKLEFIKSENITNENLALTHNESLGDFFQPALQTVNVNAKTKLSTSKENIDLAVTFSGPNVLEGLNDLQNDNLGISAMSKFVSQIKSAGTNSIKLSQT